MPGGSGIESHSPTPSAYVGRPRTSLKSNNAGRSAILRQVNLMLTVQIASHRAKISRYCASRFTTKCANADKRVPSETG